MQRKLVQHGRSTLMLSLPAGWLRAKGLQKGDTVELTEQDGSVILRPDNSEPKPVFIDARNLGHMLIRVVTIHFKLYDHIEVQLLPEQVTIIQDEMNRRWPGFEIVAIRGDRYTIKVVNNPDSAAFDSIFRKALMVGTSFAEGMEEHISSKNYKKLAELPILDDAINKLTNYCMRMINKSGYPAKPSRSLYMYLLVDRWEKMGDEIKYLCKHFSTKKNPRLGTESIALLKEAVGCVRSYADLFVNYVPETAATLSQQRKDLVERLLSFEGTKDELELVRHLINIVEFGFNCIGYWVGVHY